MMEIIINVKRIHNEYKQIKKNANEYHEYFTVTIVDDDLYHWQATINGPKESIYEGYRFLVDIRIPKYYPNIPVAVKFITPIKHINIKDGDICLNILKNDWNPSMGILSVLLSIHCLLKEPNFKDPLNSDLAAMYNQDQKKYEKYVRDYCLEHALSI
jgi:ubiquitin-conjugating enzyme E2 D/E